MPYFEHNGLSFHYLEKGEGRPFIFQHGLGGSVEQIIKIYFPPLGIRLITFDFRGHGKTPLNGIEELNFKTFADDVLALMDHLHLSKVIIGGISMGAGVALNFTLRYPNRVEALILSRPAWLNAPMEKQNRELYKLIAGLLQEHGSERGRELFMNSDVYDELSKTFPGTAQSLLGNFDHEKASETAVKFERLSADSPSVNRDEWEKITVPTLILANKSDPVHPFEYGMKYASKISQANFKEITPKSISEEKHNNDVQKNIDLFITEMKILLTHQNHRL
jgi:pimeloyl-ACP methyl ester carboxylesterase